MNSNNKRYISLVSPVYNEAEKIEEFVTRSREALISLGLPFEIVLVNDCSSDDTLKVLKKINQSCPELTVISLRRNVGQHIATAIALKQARGEFIFMMDSDLQIDPNKMINLFNEGEKLINWDIISTYRKQRSKNQTRRLGSIAVSFILRLITKSTLKDIGSTFKLIQRSALDRMLNSDIQIQNLPILMMNLGFNIIEVEVEYSIDQSRKSHYKFKDLATAIILAVLNFTTGHNTLLFLVLLGTIMSLFGTLSISAIIVWGMINQSVLPTNFLIFFLFILLIGLIFILLGILTFKLERINKNLQFRQTINEHFDVFNS